MYFQSIFINLVYNVYDNPYVMQQERVRIVSRQLVHRGIAANWTIPLTREARVDDILHDFLYYLRHNTSPAIRTYAILRHIYNTLRDIPECLFVFARSGTCKTLGILKSYRPCFSARERALLGIQTPDIPLWSWYEQVNAVPKAAPHQTSESMHIWLYR